MIKNMIKNYMNFFKQKVLNRNKELSNAPIQHLRFNGAAVFNYDFMVSLKTKDYPKYLSQAYYLKFGQKLNFKSPKNINEKIQWLKIYDNLPIKTELTDKVLVRSWIQSKIGNEYLKPVLWIGENFDKIPFNALPNSFFIKTNHGCKWHFIVKNKEEYLNNKNGLYEYTKKQINGWMSQTFFGWSDFETQYKDIKPQILIEPLLRDNINSQPIEYEIWCFNGKPQLFHKYKYNDRHEYRISSAYNDNFENIDLIFLQEDINTNEPADNNLKKAVELSKILAKEFKLVRIDWMIYQNKLYFVEMTFTPFSGFILFAPKYKDWYLKLGNMLNLKGN